jgi:hypothetical protein
MLESIRRRRIRRGSPSLGAAIERAIIRRELDELEADLLMFPPEMSIGNSGEQE